MHSVYKIWQKHPGFENGFSGNIILEEAYYSPSTIFSPLRIICKILPLLNEYSKQNKINFLISSSDVINKPIISYIKLLQLRNIICYKVSDIKTVKRLIELDLNIGKTKENIYFNFKWITRLRELISEPKNIKKFFIIRKVNYVTPSNRNLPQPIINFLISKKYIPIILDNLEIHDQINLFAGATHIVATHGAGLANIVYCNAGCKIMELSNGVNTYVFPNYVDFINKQMNITPNILLKQLDYNKDKFYAENELRKMHTTGTPPYASFNSFLQEYNSFLNN